MADPVTREGLREELAVIWGDLRKAINDLESRVGRESAMEAGGRPQAVFLSPDADYGGELGVPAPGGQPTQRQPHQWVSRHVRSYAVGAELADTHQGLNEEAPVAHTHQMAHKHHKGQGPLAQAMRRAATGVEPMGGGRRRKRPGSGVRKTNSETSSVEATSNDGGSQRPTFVQQAMSHFRRDRSRSNASPSPEVTRQPVGAVHSLNVNVGDLRNDTRHLTDASKTSAKSATSAGGSSVGDDRNLLQVVPGGSQFMPVAESQEEEEPDSPCMNSRHRRRVFGVTIGSAMSTTVQTFSSLAEATRSSLPVPEAEWYFPYICQRIVHNVLFEYLVLVFIIANAVTIGAATDHMARHVQDHTPSNFRTADVIFSTFFILELVMRITSDGCWFFTGPARIWNLLDLTIVSLQILEEAFILVGTEGGFPFATSLLRMLRFLRLVRVIRVMRLLRYITELRTIVTSLTGSLKALASSILLMFLVVYIVGIYLTQLVLNHRLELNCDLSSTAAAAAAQSGPCLEIVSLSEHFGDVGSALLGLFQSVTGGVDWGDMLRPLMEQISPLMGVVFSFYIVFTALALMNIVTGVFVETALARGREDKDVYMINHLRDLFISMDLNHNGIISWTELAVHLSNPKLLAFLKEIDIDASEASGLFRLLDKDQSGMIDADEFLSGCIRMRGPAKALDMQLVMRELTEHHNMLLGLQKAVYHIRVPPRSSTSVGTSAARMCGDEGMPKPPPPAGLPAPPHPAGKPELPVFRAGSPGSEPAMREESIVGPMPGYVSEKTFDTNPEPDDAHPAREVVASLNGRVFLQPL